MLFPVDTAGVWVYSLHPFMHAGEKSMAFKPVLLEIERK